MAKAKSTQKYVVTAGWYKHPVTGEIHENGTVELSTQDAAQGIIDGLLFDPTGKTEGAMTTKAAAPASASK